MATTPCFDKNCTKSSISLSILNRFAWNLYNRGLIFRDNQNEWQQPHVSTKTAQYHQYLCQFLTDLLETFTIGVNFFRWSKWMATTPCFNKNCTISSISLSILGGGAGGTPLGVPQEDYLVYNYLFKAGSGLECSLQCVNECVGFSFHKLPQGGVQCNIIKEGPASFHSLEGAEYFVKNCN